MAQIMLQLACAQLALNDGDFNTIQLKSLQSCCYGESYSREFKVRVNHLVGHIKVAVVERWTLLEIVTLYIESD